MTYQTRLRGRSLAWPCIHFRRTTLFILACLALHIWLTGQETINLACFSGICVCVMGSLHTAFILHVKSPQLQTLILPNCVWKKPFTQDLFCHLKTVRVTVNAFAWWVVCTEPPSRTWKVRNAKHDCQTCLKNAIHTRCFSPSENPHESWYEPIHGTEQKKCSLPSISTHNPPRCTFRIHDGCRCILLEGPERNSNWTNNKDARRFPRQPHFNLPFVGRINFAWSARILHHE